MKKLSLFMMLGLFWGISGLAQGAGPPPYPPADQNLPKDPGEPKTIKEVHRSIDVKNGEAVEGPAHGSKRTKLPVPPTTVMPTE